MLTKQLMIFGASSSDSDVMAVLGIDWTMLILQLIAFLILVALLGKFVYPVFMRIIDERQAKIEESLAAASQAESRAASAQADIEDMLKQARAEAGDIVTTAKAEANAAIEAAEAKAKQRADQIVVDAHQQIEKDILKVKETLHDETLELVALATEKVVGKTVNETIDKQVISSAVKEAV